MSPTQLLGPPRCWWLPNGLGARLRFGPRATHSQRPDRHPAWEDLVRARFLVPPGCCCSWPRVGGRGSAHVEASKKQTSARWFGEACACGYDCLPAVQAANPLGAIAQLGERLHGMQEVVGSSPISSTLKSTPPRRAACFFVYSLFFVVLPDQPSTAGGWGSPAFIRRSLIFLTFSVIGSRGSRLL